MADTREKKPEIKLSVEFVDPQLAGEWLGHNTHNRRINQTRVNKYAGAILRGEWQATGEPISFGENGGGLLNGQHRLLAVLKADQGIWSAVARNVPEGVQEVLDIGAARKLGDILQLRGEKNASALAATLRAIVQYRSTGVPLTGSGGGAVTPQQAIDELNRHAELRDQVSEVKTRLGRDRTIRVGPGLLGAFRFLFGEVTNDETADRWLDELEVPSSSVVRKLKQRLAAQRPSKMLHPKVRSALIIKGWNAWLLDEDPVLLQWRPSKEPFPTIQGEELE